ncbi:kinase-like protein [Suillus decipiens]|nr:kinase-like protein [Suillus decipiens]
MSKFANSIQNVYTFALRCVRVYKEILLGIISLYHGSLSLPVQHSAPNSITSFNHPTLVPDLTSFISWPDPLSPVSKGAYGDIYKCVYHHRDSDMDVAVKIFRPLTADEDFRRELEIWKRLRHPNILKLMGTTRFSPSVALVSPWMINGHLTLFLSQNNETLGLRDRLCLLCDIAAGLNYLHTFDFGVGGHACFNPIVHGDLTSDNILISDDGTALLADFGLSRTLTQLPDMTYLAKSSCHTVALRWLAPELSSSEESASVITTQSDIYSFGSIMLQVLTGKLPWSHLNCMQILQAVIKGQEHPRPENNHITDQYWNFMLSCWSNTPINRPSAENTLKFIVHELVLYDKGSVDTRSFQICSQLLQPVRLLLYHLLYPLKYIRNQQCGTMLEQ